RRRRRLQRRCRHQLAGLLRFPRRLLRRMLTLNSSTQERPMPAHAHALFAALLGLIATMVPASAQLVTQTPSPTGRNLGGVAFNTPDHGFVVGDNHQLIETFDAGQTWSTRMRTGFSTDPFYIIDFA